MKMKKKSLFALLLALAMLLALSACGGNSGNGGNAEDAAVEDADTDGTDAGTDGGDTADAGDSGAAFKIGGTGPLTGGAAIYGNAVQYGAKIAMDEINAAGGVNGYLLDVRYEDDTHDPEKAVNAYNVLKDWGMQLSLGSVTSKPGEATSAEIALTPSASSVATIDGKDNVFQMCFTDPGQGAKSAEYISEQGLGEKIAIIWKNDDVYSKGIRDTFVEEAAARNLEIVSETTFNDSNATDFSVQVSNAQESGADLVFLPIYYEPAALIFAQASSVGYAPKWFGVDGMDGIL